MRTTQALGVSIGSVNAVSAAATDGGAHPVVTTRRTTVTFDGDGTAHIGAVPRDAAVLADFADLAIAQDPVVVVAGRVMTGADLVAAVANRLAAVAVRSVLAYPAIYSGDQVADLRRALDEVGATGTGLVPEPVAAAAWLQSCGGAVESELVLVYDLGASCLDLAVVCAGSLAGPPVRSYDFGGRALDVAVARYAHDIEPDVESRLAQGVSADDIAELRTRQVRESVALVRDCVRAAGVAISDIDRILLIGGAARPASVAQVLADELDLPIVLGPDPAHTTALGAALLASRAAADGPALVPLGRREPRVAALAAAVLTTGLLVPAAVPVGRAFDHRSPIQASPADASSVPRYDPYRDPIPAAATAIVAPAVLPHAVLVDSPAPRRPSVPASLWAMLPDPAAHDISPLPTTERATASVTSESASTVSTTDFPSATARPDGTTPSDTVDSSPSPNSGRPGDSGRAGDPSRPNESSQPKDPGQSSDTSRLSDSGQPSGSGRPSDPSRPNGSGRTADSVSGGVGAGSSADSVGPSAPSSRAHDRVKNGCRADPGTHSIGRRVS
ncbi:FGGY-family carbohydrate kinase [Nocardia sp. CA-119907]|uniref:FGGY-family carbohydrate kinase n=1 Tax=Nocardia sp. CA-119907 TaxID=3239973 RepID=UPI003D96E3AF